MGKDRRRERGREGRKWADGAGRGSPSPNMYPGTHFSSFELPLVFIIVQN